MREWDRHNSNLSAMVTCLTPIDSNGVKDHDMRLRSWVLSFIDIQLNQKLELSNLKPTPFTNNLLS